MERFTFPMLCDALIDQNRYIGGDPVGHRCFNPSAGYCSFENLWHGHLCEKCRDAITGKAWDEQHAATQIKLLGPLGIIEMDRAKFPNARWTPLRDVIWDDSKQSPGA